MNSIKDFFKKVRIDTIIRAILLLVMAIMFFIDPEGAMVSTSILFSAFILCDGIFSMFVYFFSYGLSGFFGTTLLGSVFKILYGLLFLSSPGFSTITFSLLFAVYIIAVSCNTVEESMYLKRVGSHWVLPLILGIVSLAGGITMLFMTPGSLVKASGIIAGITLVVASVEDIIIIVDMYKVKKRVEPKVIDADVIDVK